jgi:hypothetical protein
LPREVLTWPTTFLKHTVIIEQRREEPSRSLEEYLSDRRKKGK